VGRRITVSGITGTFRGIALAAAAAFDRQRRTVIVPGAPHIHIVDSTGKDHHLDFHAADRVTVLN
jgi:hypothetical protein